MTIETVIAIAKTLKDDFFCVTFKSFGDGKENYYAVEYLINKKHDSKFKIVSLYGWKDCLKQLGWKG